MAPELMTKNVISYGAEVDTYSFGLTMWVIISEAHQDPFTELDVCVSGAYRFILSFILTLIIRTSLSEVRYKEAIDQSFLATVRTLYQH